MPHVIFKLWPGKSEQQKARLTEAIVEDVMNVLNYGENSISVAIEEIGPEEWAEQVYRPEILEKPEALYKKPGYPNLTLRGGPAPVRAYMSELMDDVLAGTLDSLPVFDMTVDLDGVPEGYAAMDERRALKVLVKI